MHFDQSPKPGQRLSAKLSPSSSRSAPPLRFNLGANYALGLLSDKNVLGTAVVALDGQVVEINDYYLTHILGYTREDFERDGLNILEVTPADYRDNESLKAELRRTGRITAFERPRYKKDGSVVWTLNGYAFMEGRSDLMSCWALDITDKKRSEMTSQYLLEANKIMAESVELQPLLEKIVAVTLVNGFCDFCTIHFPEVDNRISCRAMIHKDPELTLQVKRVIERYPRYLSDAIGPARVIRTGKSEMSRTAPPVEEENDHGGQSRYYSLRALALKSYMSVPLFLEGKTIGALTLTSMSRQFEPEDLKTAEALALRASQHIENAKLHESLKQSAGDLERSNRDLTYFASIAAHDLKSPLATSQSFLNLLRDECAQNLTPEQNTWLNKAISASEKMLQQVDRLLSFSQCKTGQADVQPVDMNGTVRAALDNLRTDIEGQNFDFRFESLPTVKGDPTLLVVLFQNLFSNSIRYRAHEPLRVEIRAEHNDKGWTFQVTDNGRGFDSKRAEQIFRLFEQLPDRDSQAGLGIGLATCRKIIESHHGTIWAESAPGHGSKFSFTLPG